MEKSSPFNILLAGLVGANIGIGLRALTDKDNHRFAPTLQECTELREASGSWLQEQNKDPKNETRNRIREVCNVIIFENTQTPVKK